MNEIITLAGMLSKTFGRLVQLTVSDTEKYLYVDGAIDESVVAGRPVGGNERFFIESEEISSLPFVVNYKSLSGKMNKLRSSTFFFKDAQGHIEYLLSITTQVDEFLYLRDIIDTFVNGEHHAASMETAMIDQTPKLELSAHDLIETVIQEGQKRFSAGVERMTKQEKQSLIREMRSRGVFLIKGAVTEAARKLGYSETTVYRYLQKLEQDA